jgi:DNA-binding response OmpR family regulator
LQKYNIKRFFWEKNNIKMRREKMFAIIDDTPQKREELKANLVELLNFNVDLFESGDKFIEKYKDENIKKYKLIFLDGTLFNGTNSMEVLKFIKKTNENQAVILYGGVSLEDMEDWKSIGMDDLLTKPVNKNHLMHLLKRYRIV